VIERFVSLARGGDRHIQVVAHAFLSDVVVERPRPQPGFILGVVLET